MHSESLALTFDRAVSDNPSDSDWTGVTLRTHVNKLEAVGVTLWHTEGEAGWGSPVASTSGLTLTVIIHPIDMDEIRAAAIGHNKSFTWLALREGVFLGTGGVEVSDPIYGTEVLGSEGMHVSTLEVDTTSISNTNVSNSVTLECSRVEYGERRERRIYRELVIHLDQACGKNRSRGDHVDDWGLLEEIRLAAGLREGTNLFLNATSNFITDFAYDTNPIYPVEGVEESSP
ncbi:unnamed protein product, partial [Choristocarpus tenellus]